MRHRYTDLHIHILPGLDDGAQTWNESLQMAKLAQESGARRIIATPHYIKGAYLPEAETIRTMVETLKGQLASSGIDLQVFPGEEVHLDSDLPSLYEEGRILCLGDSGYVLIELPFDILPSYTPDVLFRLSLKGAGVILAHPERNRDIRQNLELLSELTDLGAYVQINAGSLLGSYGRHVEAAAVAMARRGLVHFIGSDAHAGRDPSPFGRGPDVSGAMRRLCRYSRQGDRILAVIEERVDALLSGTLA